MERNDISDCEFPEGDDIKHDFLFKIIVLGNSNVGKSCISLRLTRGVFEDKYLATIGFEYYNFNVRIQGKNIKLQIWDTCGQEQYKSVIKNYFKGAAAAFIVYAINE